MHGRLVSRRIDALYQCFLVSFGIIFENGILPMYTLESVSSVANHLLLMKSLSKTETPIFLSVLCLQRQSF